MKIRAFYVRQKVVVETAADYGAPIASLLLLNKYIVLSTEKQTYYVNITIVSEIYA